MSSNQDPARLIADRVARRLAAESATRDGKTSDSRNGARPDAEQPRARVINFVSSTPPSPRFASPLAGPEEKSGAFESSSTSVPQVAQSPWLAPFSHAASQSSAESAERTQSLEHPSQQRFGVEEASVSELVDFFENEKQCSVDPSGKPCDHCAMCSSRGF